MRSRRCRRGLPENFSPDVAAARAPVETAVREGRRWLDPLEAAAVMAAYAIPAVPPGLAGEFFAGCRRCARAGRDRGPRRTALARPAGGGRGDGGLCDPGGADGACP